MLNKIIDKYTASQSNLQPINYSKFMKGPADLSQAFFESVPELREVEAYIKRADLH